MVNEFQNDLVKSYRCLNGVLNNPRADRRTTAGTFHVVDWRTTHRLATSGSCRSSTFVKLFQAAMEPPQELDAAALHGATLKTTWLTLGSRCCCARWFAPVSPDSREYKSLETRFYAPGNSGQQSGFRRIDLSATPVIR